MKWMNHILLFEDFMPDMMSEDLQSDKRNLELKKSKYSDRIAIVINKSRESGLKSARFKEKAAKTTDPLSKKIYQNRSNEETVKQQVYNARAKAMQAANKLNDLELKNIDLRITRKESQKA